MAKTSKAVLVMTAILAVMLSVGGLSAAAVLADNSPPVVSTTDVSSTTSSEQTVTTTDTEAQAQQQALLKRQIKSLKRGIVFLRQSTHHWQFISFVALTPGNPQEKWSQDVQYLRWRVRVWMIRRDKAKSYALNPPHLAAWLCIHRYEGAWNDPRAPYYGGLQMDIGFQRTYGHRFLVEHHGQTADYWAPLEQMWTAELALRAGRGFWPWPNSARYCGYL